MLIGITGLIGSGKSEVARIFKKNGAFVISADKIGKNVVEKNKSILNKLARAFGPGILTPSGRLRRKKLGELAFSSGENKKILNRIVHPALLKELFYQSHSAAKKYEIVVIDAALLINWGWDKKVDMTILVHATRKNRLSRLLRKGYAAEEFHERTKSQLKYSELSRHANLILLNNSSKKALVEKVNNIISGLSKRG